MISVIVGLPTAMSVVVYLTLKANNVYIPINTDLLDAGGIPLFLAYSALFILLLSSFWITYDFPKAMIFKFKEVRITNISNLKYKRHVCKTKTITLLIILCHIIIFSGLLLISLSLGNLISAMLSAVIITIMSYILTSIFGGILLCYCIPNGVLKNNFFSFTFRLFFWIFATNILYACTILLFLQLGKHSDHNYYLLSICSIYIILLVVTIYSMINSLKKEPSHYSPKRYDYTWLVPTILMFLSCVFCLGSSLNNLAFYFAGLRQSPSEAKHYIIREDFFDEHVTPSNLLGKNTLPLQHSNQNTSFNNASGYSSELKLSAYFHKPLYAFLALNLPNYVILCEVPQKNTPIIFYCGDSANTIDLSKGLKIERKFLQETL